MNNVEYDKCAQHWERVQTVLIRLVGGNGALESLAVFAETKDNSCLRIILVSGLVKGSINVP
jgi:hypothetical protein